MKRSIMIIIIIVIIIHLRDFEVKPKEKLLSHVHFLWFVDLIEKLIVILPKRIHNDFEIEKLHEFAYLDVIHPK